MGGLLRFVEEEEGGWDHGFRNRSGGFLSLKVGLRIDSDVASVIEELLVLVIRFR